MQFSFCEATIGAIMAISNNFQNRINELIQDIEIKKSKLPSEIGIDYRSLANALNYGIIPSTRILIRIADYFNISIKYLLGQTDDEYFQKTFNDVTFETRLKELCSENDVTYYQVSKDCHFSNSYISRWINFGYLPSLEFLDILSDYFNVSIDYLLGRTDNRTPYN